MEITSKANKPLASKPTASNADDPGKVLSIVGLVLVFFMPLIGLIVSIVAYFQSKKANIKNPIAILGIVLNAIFTLMMIILIGMMIIFGFWIFGTISEANNRDNVRKAEIEHLGLEVERYIQTYNSYPTSLQDLSSLDGFDNQFLVDPNGSAYNYQPTPSGCDIAKTCNGYVISAKVEIVKNGQDTIEYSNIYKL